MTDLSVIIPARNEIYLQKTIESVLSAMEADTEIIGICDGYWPSPSIPDHPRVTLIHHTESVGQRAAINEAARLSKAKFLMKLDAHSSVGQGFDRILMADYQPDWTVIPRMRNLDIKTWLPRDMNDDRTAIRRGKLHDYMYIGFNDKNELRTLYYPGAENARWHARPELIDETMSCMGCCFFMSRERFWELDGCDEGHGGSCGWGQQGIEVALKAWLSGGSLMVNKKTWFAHWFRPHEIPYHLSGHDVDRARAYSKDLWLNDKWPKATRKLSWLIEKFNPPGWENYLSTDKVREVNTYLYEHIHKKHHDTTYRGVVAVKMPSDLLLYHRVIYDTHPEVIIEIGTRFGGSALYLQDQLDLVGASGRVVTIDIRPQVVNPDPRITYLLGNSTSTDILTQVKELTTGKRVMVILDGDHRRIHVKWELTHYAPLVTTGCYLVIEDCYSEKGNLYGPGQARDWFLSVNRKFQQTNLDQEYLVGFCRGGWLRRKA